MITDETVKKADLARKLLAEVREELKEYAQTGFWRTSGLADPRLSEIREQVEQQQAAVRSVNKALGALPEFLVLIGAIWERLGKPEAQQAPRITWRAGRFADHRGTVGGVEAFVIHWHTQREDPNYFTESKLPGLRLAEKHDDLAVLKAACEAAFSAWLARLGGGS